MLASKTNCECVSSNFSSAFLISRCHKLVTCQSRKPELSSGVSTLKTFSFDFISLQGTCKLNLVLHLYGQCVCDVLSHQFHPKKAKYSLNLHSCCNFKTFWCLLKSMLTIHFRQGKFGQICKFPVFNC